MLSEFILERVCMGFWESRWTFPSQLVEREAMPSPNENNEAYLRSLSDERLERLISEFNVHNYDRMVTIPEISTRGGVTLNPFDTIAQEIVRTITVSRREVVEEVERRRHIARQMHAFAFPPGVSIPVIVDEMNQDISAYHDILDALRYALAKPNKPARAKSNDEIINLWIEKRLGRLAS